MHEPRDPPSEVVKVFRQKTNNQHHKVSQTVTQKAKDGRDRFEARRPVAELIPTDLSAAPNRMPAAHLERTERALPSPAASARCFAIAREATTARIC